MSPKKRKPGKSRNARTPRSITAAGLPPRRPAPDAGPPELAAIEASRVVPDETVVAEPFEDQVAEPEEEPVEEPSPQHPREPVTAALLRPPSSPAPEREPAPRDEPTSERPRLLPVLLAGLILVLVVTGAGVVVHRLRGSGLSGTTTPGGRRYVAPVPVSAGTAFVSTQVVAPQTLRVTHWIHTDQPVFRVRISAPQVPGVVTGAIRVSDLVVASGAQTVSGVTAPAQGSAHVYVVPAGRWIYVSYVLSGVLQRSGTPKGRALAPLTALGVSTDQDPVVTTLHRVVGAQVLALACSSTSHPAALVRPCGTVRDGTWQVELRGAHTGDRVLAQMNLS